MTQINLTNQEAKIFNEQDSMVILRILKEQPPDYHWDLNATEWKYVHIKLRYPSGLYNLKETWGICYNCQWEDIFLFVYKADLPDILSVKDRYNYTDVDKWHSPVTMPADAVRWKDVKVDTTVKRVQDLTEVELFQAGTPSIFNESSCGSVNLTTSGLDIKWFIKHFNALHAKPVKQGDGYVCYPYSKDGVLYMADNKNYDYPPETWKGKSLIIKPNPYLMVLRLGEK